jgi:hypothetical protein
MTAMAERLTRRGSKPLLRDDGNDTGETPALLLLLLDFRPGVFEGDPPPPRLRRASGAIVA